MSNIIRAVFCDTTSTSASDLYQYDYGQILKFEGIDLPSTYEVHFCNEGEDETITVLGNADGVEIPDQFLTDGAAVRAWVFLHTGNDDGETEYAVRMPVTERPQPSDIQPTPVQHDIITQAIAALNTAVTETSASAQTAAAGSAQTASTKATEASNSAQTAAGSATAAGNSATAAAGSATTAQTAAQTATNKASEASSSASAASTAKTGAETARTGAQTAQAAAETAQANAEAAASSVSASAAQIEQNTEDIAGLKNDLSEKADKTDALSAYIVETETGAIASFTDGADDVPVKDLTVAIEPVQSGSGDPSSSNVRPISGWTGANVTACGVNIFNPDASTYETFDLTGQGTYRYGHAYPSGTYTIIYTGTNGYFFYRVPTKDLSDRGTTVNITPNSTTTVTVDANHMLWVFTQSTDNPASDLMVALGTETVFKAFQGETYEVDWTTEAGTVYGGTLDVTTGMLTVDRAYLTNAQLVASTWTEAGRGIYVAPSSYTLPNNDNSTYVNPLLLATALPTKSQNVIYTDAPTQMGIAQWWGNRFAIGFADASISTTTAFKTKLAENGSDVVYPLATPQTYQLTPQEVQTILGQNNIFADCGNVTVQYRADTKLYIDKVISA